MDIALNTTTDRKLRLLSDLEPAVCDAAMAAQILATLFEDAEEGTDLRKEPVKLHKMEADQIRFMIYDLCARTQKVQTDFYAAMGAN